MAPKKTRSSLASTESEVDYLGRVPIASTSDGRVKAKPIEAIKKSWAFLGIQNGFVMIYTASFK